MGRFLIDCLLPSSRLDEAWTVYTSMKEDGGPRMLLTNYSIIAFISALTSGPGGKESWRKVLELLHDLHVGTPAFGAQRSIATRVQVSTSISYCIFICIV